MTRARRHRGVRTIFPVLAAVSLAGLEGCAWFSKPEPPEALHLPAVGVVETLDPARVNSAVEAAESARAYESPLAYHYLKRPYELAPLLLEDVPTSGADGRTYLLKVRKGILFQDDRCFAATEGRGRELTAEDLVYTLERLADPEVASPAWAMLDGRIEGLNEWREAALAAEKADYSKTIEGLRAVDRYTVRVRLTERFEPFVHLLTTPAAAAVAREAVECHGGRFGSQAVGTGPYVLKELDGSSRIIWARNPTFHGEGYPKRGESDDRKEGLLRDAGQALPLAERVVVRVFPSLEEQWEAFLAGDLDLAEAPPGLESLHLRKGMRTFSYPPVEVTHEAFNLRDPLFARNVSLRKALSLSVDPRAIAWEIFGDAAIPASGPLPPGLSAAVGPATVERRPDLSKARELLAQAGYPEGRGLPALRYASLSDASSRRRTELLRQAFAAIGVRLVPRFAASWSQFQAWVKEGEAQLWGFTWSADYADAQSLLQLFYGKSRVPAGPGAAYSNPGFDRLYEEAMRAGDSSKRDGLYGEMARLVEADSPWIFSAHRVRTIGVQPWLRNYKPHAFRRDAARYFRVDRPRGK